MGSPWGAAQAQDGSQNTPQNTPQNTVVTVNGMAITYDDISMAEDELMGLVGQLPERQRFETLVNFMVERLLAANAARQAGLENYPQAEKRSYFLWHSALQCSSACPRRHGLCT